MGELRKYKVYNELTGETSDWINGENDLLNYCKCAFVKALDCGPIALPSVPLAIKFHKNDNTIIQFTFSDYFMANYSHRVLTNKNNIGRFLLVTDEYGRTITPRDLSVLSYDKSDRTYKINTWCFRKYAYNRKKALREKDSGYRREPVSRTGKHYGHYGRRISYKGTQLDFENEQCKEYGIKAYRSRRVLDAWDIEPVEDCNRSWKNTKCKKQYMKHMRKHYETGEVLGKHEACLQEFQDV